MAMEQEIRNRQREQEIVVCPPTTFGNLLGFDGKKGIQYRLARAKVNITKISKNDQSHYLALVDLRLKGDSLGEFLHQISPAAVTPNEHGIYARYSRWGIVADWIMPDRQQHEEYQRLLRIHKAAFPVEWDELELDRKLLIAALEGREDIFPLISWNVDSAGQRRYDLTTPTFQVFQLLRKTLSFGHRLQAIYLSSSYPRAFNPNLGLVAALYSQPEFYKQWPVRRLRLPHPRNNDYKGNKQTMMAAQMPLLVLWIKNEILAGKPFDAMEEYANSK